MKFRPSSLLLLAALAGVISTSSCVKSYTCHCDITYTGVPGLPDSTNVEYIIKDTKSNAKSKCSAESNNYSNGTQSPEQGTVNTTENCYLY